jgi:hypothetical protein
MSAGTELASRYSSEEMSVAASENEGVRLERVAEAFRGKRYQAYLIASPAPFLEPELGFAGTILRHSLWKTLARSVFKSCGK